jgi:hypothetical protein
VASAEKLLAMGTTPQNRFGDRAQRRVVDIVGLGALSSLIEVQSQGTDCRSRGVK